MSGHHEPTCPGMWATDAQQPGDLALLWIGDREPQVMRFTESHDWWSNRLGAGVSGDSPAIRRIEPVCCGWPEERAS